MITFQLRLDHQPRLAGIRRFDSFDRFDDHWRSTLATPLLVRFSYRDWAIVTDYSEMFWRINSPVSCFLGTSAEPQIRTIIHWIDVPSRVLFKLRFLAYWSTRGSACPLSLDISPWWAQSRGVSIFVRPLSVFHVQSYMVRNRLTVDLRDPGLGLLSFRKKL